QELRLPVKRICEDDNKVEVYLKNMGTIDSSYSLSLSATDTIVLVDTEYALLPGEEQRIPLEVAEGIMPGKYELKMRSDIIGLDPEETDKFSSVISTNVEVVSLADCYRPELVTKRIKISHEEATSLLQLKNIGLEDEDYSLELNGPDWAYLEEDEISINKGTAVALELVTSPSEEISEGNYDLQLIITSEETDNQYIENFRIIISDYTLLEYILMNRCIIVFLLMILVDLAFFAKFLFDILSSNKRHALVDLLVILIALILAAAVFTICFDKFSTSLGLAYQNNIDATDNLCETYYSESVCESDYYIRMDEDTRHEIDLSGLFYDPDEDLLDFSTSDEIEDIVVDIRGSTAVLIPEKDWYGTKSMRFTAEDGNGGYAESRKFHIHVLDTEEVYLQDFVLDNHLWISVTAIVIFSALSVFLIVLFFNDSNSEKEKKETSKEDKKKK
ncbi:hypothetical protein JXC34_02435, partial [Candidatus Woesearchaeota archaeon]|nr:hypothetical protein [Candidatus Woesearchaeota archaeon]